MTARLFVLGAALALTVACFEEEQPCDDYVDYVCACHEGEEGFDCDELRAVLGDAEPDVQDQCAIDLAELQGQDADAGIDCEV